MLRERSVRAAVAKVPGGESAVGCSSPARPGTVVTMTCAPERSGPELDVSVLVTSPPGSARLDEALASVARQTVRPRDVVVVEGGAARNAAVARAASAWIAFCRAGDVWAPHKLARHATAAWYCPDASFTFSDWYAMETERAARCTTCSDPAYRAVRRVPVAPNIVRLDRRALGAALYASEFLVVSTLVVKRAVLERVIGSYGAGDDGDDYDATLRLAACAGAAAAVEEPLVGHRPRARRWGDPASRSALWSHLVAAPELYPPGARDFVRADRRRCTAAAGLSGLGAGRFTEARRYLRESVAIAATPSTLSLYAVATALDTPLGRYLGARLPRRPQHAVLED